MTTKRNDNEIKKIRIFFNELCVIIPGVGGVLPRVSAPGIPVAPKLPLLVGFIAYSFDDLADACKECIFYNPETRNESKIYAPAS